MEKFAASDLPMKTSLIRSVDYVGNSDFNKLAEEYYSGNRMDKFIAIFSELEVSTQKMYCDRMYADDKIDFFATGLKIMGTDAIPHYVEKAYADGKVNFMSLMLSLLSDDTKGEWVVTIAPDLLSEVETDSQTRQWLEENLKLIPNTMNQTHQNAVNNGARVISCNISFDGYDSMTTQVHAVYEAETGTDEMKKNLEEIRTKNKEQKKQQEELLKKRENSQTQKIVTNNAENLLGKVAGIDFAHNNNLDGVSIDFTV